MQNERSVNKKREDIHAALQSSKLGSAISKFDRLSGAERLNTNEFVVPVPVKTVNKPSSEQEVELTRPQLSRDSLGFVRKCGFDAKEGTFAGSSHGMITLPKSGLVALAFVLENIPAAESKGSEFLRRSFSFFGRKDVDYDQLINGLDSEQIAFGAILLKVATEGMSGLNGDLFLSTKFNRALDRQKPDSSEQVLSKMLDIQGDVLQSLTSLVQ